VAPLRFPGWVLGVPFALLISWFAVSNRGPVTLELWPLPNSVEVPVYLAILAALGVGFVLGATAAIVSAMGRRRK
jgi:uncharacterized integral membrane protein